MKICVLTRGKYGHRAIENIRNNTPFELVEVDIPLKLPELIDDPESYVDSLDIDLSFGSADIILSYALHPDITEELIRRAGRAGVKAFIATGGFKAGSPVQLGKVAEESGVFLVTHEVCCSLAGSKNPTVKEYLKELGSPIVEIEVNDGHIKSVDVLRSSPCGGTRFMAENLPGTPISKAPGRAGLLVQQYPCRAVRGTKEGIHASGEIHLKAVERALRSQE